jgi:hypothetical protein
MYYGDRVLGHLGGICPVRIVAYGVRGYFVLSYFETTCRFISGKNRIQGGPHGRSGRSGEEKNLLPLPEFEPPDRPARRLGATTTMLSQLSNEIKTSEKWRNSDTLSWPQDMTQTTAKLHDAWGSSRWTGVWGAQSRLDAVAGKKNIQELNLELSLWISHYSNRATLAPRDRNNIGLTFNLLKPNGYLMHQHSTIVHSAYYIFKCFVFIRE